jgi:hypothetical protein
MTEKRLVILYYSLKRNCEEEKNVPNFEELQNKIVEEYVLGCNKF